MGVKGLLRLVNLLLVLLVGHSFPDGNAREEEDDESGEDGRQDGDPLDALDDVQRDDEDTPPQHNLAEVVRVAAHLPQTFKKRAEKARNFLLANKLSFSLRLCYRSPAAEIESI